jgi:hypothetical protein
MTDCNSLTKNLKKEVTTSITAITVNYKTLDLISKAIDCFRKFYPKVPLIIIDGSTYDPSSDWIFKFSQQDKNTTCLFNTFNLHHGPSLHAGLTLTRTPYAYLFDSDTFHKQDGLLEQMLYLTKQHKEWFMVGKIGIVRENGYDDKINGTIKYINPRCALVNCKTYFSFKPFIKHGAPCISSMIDVNKRKCENLLLDFDYWPYVNHLFMGTVHRTGGFHL